MNLSGLRNLLMRCLRQNYRAFGSDTKGYIVIKRDDVEQFCIKSMQAVKTREKDAVALAQVLVAADHRGHYSHGLNRIEMYVNDVLQGMCEIEKEPIVLKETVSTAYVDGNNCLGPVVGNLCMQMAISKAKSTGVGWVAAKGSNHYGIAGWYSMQASHQGLLGISCTNTSPLVFATRSKKLALGTNPITVAAPANDPKDEFVLDMATSTAALGKIEMCRRKKIPIPEGWGADKEGKMTTSADEAYEGGLMPLGGRENTGGYKGYGLSMMVEMFCGLLSDAHYGPHVRRWMNATTPADLGQCFAAIDPNAFAPGFTDRVSKFTNELRQFPALDKEKPVLIPGDPERSHVEACNQLGGIPYPPVLIQSMNKLAEKLKIKPMPVVKILE